MHVLFFLRKKDLYKVDINEELFLSNGNDQTQVNNVDIYFWNTTYCWYLLLKHNILLKKNTSFLYQLDSMYVSIPQIIIHILRTRYNPLYIYFFRMFIYYLMCVQIGKMK